MCNFGQQIEIAVNVEKPISLVRSEMMMLHDEKMNFLLSFGIWSENEDLKRFWFSITQLKTNQTLVLSDPAEDLTI